MCSGNTEDHLKLTELLSSGQGTSGTHTKKSEKGVKSFLKRFI